MCESDRILLYNILLFKKNISCNFIFYVILDSLGPEYGEGRILNLETTWEESEPRTPLICILSIGSDPSTQISQLAKAKEIGKILKSNKYVKKLGLLKT